MLVLIVALWCTIPTVSRAIRPPNPYNYWWLRSPVTGNIDNGARVVKPDGVVYSGYNFVGYESYGRRSPSTYFLYGDGMSYRTESSGNVDIVNDSVMQFTNVTDSYGRI